MWTATFWRDLGERALKTAAQAVVALLVADGTGLLATNWGAVLSTAGMATLLSVLSSVASNALSPDGTASLLPDTRENTPQ